MAAVPGVQLAETVSEKLETHPENGKYGRNLLDPWSL